ncbi:type II toxin-antitoxin system RelE family toxin [Candidatus Nanohalococcus occultus]|uniref:Uncharacterized protein n=1 Tax=Candidatus Nanohalococcus occultus TaxID=2978047 RepID=A0ABY8CD35_9ARCH|nr:hypothetical protein SVXNc_0100 [Candidatus Nanohaloarchaeota archaeon SVXNc]
MEIVVEPGAKQDLKEIEGPVRQTIGKAIENLAEDPLPENSYVIYLPDNTEIQVLKLQEEDRNSKLNHRVTYDIVENDHVRVYGVFSRQSGYQNIKQNTAKRVE